MTEQIIDLDKIVPTTIVPTTIVPTTIVPTTIELLEKVKTELQSFLSGNTLTLVNMTGVIIDLYNFIKTFKHLTTNQKSLIIVTVLKDFVNKNTQSDPILIMVIELLVPRIVDAFIGISNGTIDVKDIVDDVINDIRKPSCFSCCFSKK